MGLGKLRKIQNILLTILGETCVDQFVSYPIWNLSFLTNLDTLESLSRGMREWDLTCQDYSHW
jgi:hypothetical protein